MKVINKTSFHLKYGVIQVLMPNLIVVAGMIAVMLFGIFSHQLAWILAGVIPFGLELLFIVPGIIQRLRPLIISSDQLLIPGYPLGHKRLPINDITGIGLLKTSSPSVLGQIKLWRLHIWAKGSNKPIDGILNLKNSIVKNDIGKTQLADITKELYEAIKNEQGPERLLANTNAQVHPPEKLAKGIIVEAHWSPTYKLSS